MQVPAFLNTFFTFVDYMEEKSIDLKLKERVRELKCLYALSKIVWEEKNDLHAIFLKTLAILPQAMQYPALSEVSIHVNKKVLRDTPFCKKHVVHLIPTRSW